MVCVRVHASVLTAAYIHVEMDLNFIFGCAAYNSRHNHQLIKIAFLVYVVVFARYFFSPKRLTFSLMPALD